VTRIHYDEFVENKEKQKKEKKEKKEADELLWLSHPGPSGKGLLFCENGTIFNEKNGKIITNIRNRKIGINGIKINNISLFFADLFVPNSNPASVVHINGNMSDNRASNLKWSETNNDFQWKKVRKDVWKYRIHFESYWDENKQLFYKYHDACPSII
jgi:hypothetical protein